MSVIQRLKNAVLRAFSDKGLVLTLALSITLLLVFYGKLLRDPAHTYFGTGGDGMQVYYQTLYHTKYDTAFWYQQSINYPYGESIFFTSAMPMVNNAVKLFGPSAATGGVALINLLMLFSIPAGAVFIYLVFRHLRLPWLYGAVCAVAIAFFSPQVGRMMGHYALSWVFLIPAMVYFLLRFYESPSLKQSLIIGALSLLAATTHLYFFAFFAGLSVMYWLVLLLLRDAKISGFGFALKHFCIQVILPFAIVQLLVWLSSDVTDRTTVPKGFLFYRSNMAGVFFPFGEFYQPAFEKIMDPEKVEAEGMAYVGLAAMFGMIIGFFTLLFTAVRGRFRRLLAVTDNRLLNIFFWTSLLMLFISFGHPFTDGLEEWLAYTGPLRQFRAIGRFTWVFYYMANIVVVYQVYKITSGKKAVQYVSITLVAALLCMDMLTHTIRTSLADQMNNRIAELADEQNELPANAWLKNFNVEQYQAILPLPYYHVGSENLMRLTSDPEIVKQSFIVSLKTGLPLMSVSSSRTSLSQTLKLLALVQDPAAPLEVLSELPDQRPLLLVVRSTTLDENEQRLVSLADSVGTSQEYTLYSLQPAAIAAMVQQQYALVKAEMQAQAKYPAASSAWISSDSLYRPFCVSFDEESGTPFSGKASLRRCFGEHQIIFDGGFNYPAGEYRVTFWVSRIRADVFPRNVIYIVATDPSGQSKPVEYISDVSVSTRMISGDWGLQEAVVKIPFTNPHLTISMWNDELRAGDANEVDELLITPSATHVYRQSGDTIYRDNRRYIPLQ